MCGAEAPVRDGFWLATAPVPPPQVPLIHDDNHRAAALVGISGDGGIKLADAFGGINHQQRNVGSFQMLARHHHGKLLRHQVGLAFAADAGSVDETESAARRARQFRPLRPAWSRESARRWRGRVPVSRFSSVDFPTLGWPMMATLISVVGSLVASGLSALRPLSNHPAAISARRFPLAASGRTSSTASSRSSTPRPCSAEMGNSFRMPRR